MKYKLKKGTPWIAVNAIIIVNDGGTYITNDKYEEYRDGKDYTPETYSWLNWMIKNHPEDFEQVKFEEVKETTKPRWKVGDNVTSQEAETEYIKISKVTMHKGKYYYDNC